MLLPVVIFDFLLGAAEAVGGVVSRLEDIHPLPMAARKLLSSHLGKMLVLEDKTSTADPFDDLNVALFHEVRFFKDLGLELLGNDVDQHSSDRGVGILKLLAVSVHHLEPSIDVRCGFRYLVALRILSEAFRPCEGNDLARSSVVLVEAAPHLETVACLLDASAQLYPLVVETDRKIVAYGLLEFHGQFLGVLTERTHCLLSNAGIAEVRLRGAQPQECVAP